MKTAAILLTLFATAALAEDNVSRPDPSQEGFATQEAAAIAALVNVKTLDNKNEHSGVVFLRNGVYFYTLPATSGASNKTRVQVAVYTDAKIVALYHNHPAPLGNDRDLTMVFSPFDVKQADSLKVDPYILINKSGEVREYSPGVDPRTSTVELRHVINGDIADGHSVTKL